MKIQIRAYQKRGANGDRDTSGGVEYFDYEVVLIKPDGMEGVLRKFGGYDNWWTAPKAQGPLREQVVDYTVKQAAFFEAEMLPMQCLRPKPPKPQDTEWEEF